MYIKKLPRAFNKTPKFTGPKINPQFAEGIKRYNTKNKNIRNWMFVFVYSSYYLNLQIGLNTHTQKNPY